MSDDAKENEQVDETVVEPGHAEAAEADVEVVSDTEDSTEELLAQAQEDLAVLKDQMIREQAETQNIRKRVQKDVENARKFALEKFVEELLPVADNLERALEAAGDEEATQGVKEGVDLTYKSLLQAFEKFNVKQVSPIGEPFDANLHQAMTMVPNPDMEPNSVMDCMQKGYTLNDRLVRPAMVIVSKAP